MILEKLGKFIIIDEIHPNATAPGLYFLSCLLGNEMLSLSEDWSGRIYTSQFIYDVLLKKKPKVHSKSFRVLKANVPIKFKSKDKIIWVTMFESEDIKNSVMFYFDDGINKYLYTGAFNDISSCYRNQNFMLCIQKGIDYVYIDTVLSNTNPYICTEDTIDEIKAISLKHPDSRLAVVIPNFGYEKLLVELVQAFPQNVCPTKTQKYILTKLGQSQYLSNNWQTCRIIILIPGLIAEHLEADLIIIYITVGDASTLNNEYGVYLRQWSPLPSLMDQQVLLEMIRPNHTVPIELNGFEEENFDLPFTLRSLVKKTLTERFDQDSSDTETWPENNSIRSIQSNTSAATGTPNYLPSVSMASTKLFCPQAQSSKNPITEKSKYSGKEKEVPISDEVITKENKVSIDDKVNKKLPATLKCTNLTKPRTRVIRQRTDLDFSDSDDDFQK